MNRIPTTTEIYDSIIAGIEAEFSITIPTIGQSFFRAFAWVLAGIFKLMYLRIGNVQKNISILTADPVSQGGALEIWGWIKMGRYPGSGSAAQYTVTVTGTVAATIPAGTQWISNDSSQSPGYLYILETAYVMPGSTGTITLLALTAGTESLLAIGDTLTAVIPLTNVNQIGTIATVSVTPVNAETIEEYRAKGLQAYRITPQGGAAPDYRLWGLDAAGTRQIYPYTTSGVSNEVTVYVEALPADSTDGKGTPTSTILTDVANDIETDPVTGLARRPMPAFIVNVDPIVVKLIDITIDSGGAITLAQQTLIDAALAEYAYGVRPFIAGIDMEATRNDNIDAFTIGSIVVSIFTGVISSITFDVSGTPEVSYNFDNGEIPFVDSVTYI